LSKLRRDAGVESHVVDVRPTFRSQDWEAYQSVNARFAAVIDSELTSDDTPVFIQDYHTTP